jgi:hypothetical protein
MTGLGGAGEREGGRGINESAYESGLLGANWYIVKNFNRFPVPSRDVTNQTILFPHRESWLATSWLGTGRLLTFFTVYGSSSHALLRF